MGAFAGLPQPATSNPMVAELLNLSPGAKAALAGAAGAAGAAAGPQQVPAGNAAPAPVAGPPPPGRLLPMAMPQGAARMDAGGAVAGAAMPQLGAAPAPAPSLPNVKAPLGTADGDMAERARLIETGPATSQIAGKIENSGFGQDHPKLGRLLGDLAEVPARIGDTLLSRALPGLASAIPGTEARHNYLLNQADTHITQDQKAAQQQAATADTKAQTAEREELGEKYGVAAEADRPFDVTPEMAEAAGVPELAGQKVSQATYQKLFGGTQTNATREEVGAGHDAAGVQKQQMKDDAAALLNSEKIPQRDDHYISILTKPVGERTPADLAYQQAYEQYIHTTKTVPGLARASYMMQMPIAVADPNNPGGEVFMTRKDAIGQGAPGGIGTKLPQSVAKDLATGPDGKLLTNIRTADAHIQQLRQIALALHNGEVPLLNELANNYAQATGDPAPVNFQLLKTALAGEIAKTTTGGVATNEETSELTKAINASESPEQIFGVTDAAHRLMQSKGDQIIQQLQRTPQNTLNAGGGKGAGKADYVYVTGKGLVKQ
jgi:hypothetical protein